MDVEQAILRGMSRDAVIRSFNGIVTDIEAALNTNTERVLSEQKVLLKDRSVTQALEARAARHYRIALPSRAIAVNASLTNVTGTLPLLWASTSVQRPTAREFEYRGKECKLVYEHLPIPAEDGTDALMFPCRELFLTVDAAAGNCRYTLTATFGRAVSRLNIAGIRSPKLSGLQARLAKLQDSYAREQFEEELSAKAKEKRRRARRARRESSKIS